jgi:hypothetical protein
MYHSREYKAHAVMAYDSVQFGTGVQTLGRHLQVSPSRYPEEGGSDFLLTPPTCLPHS